MITFHENEEHLMTIRKHWIVLAGQLLPLFVLAILPLLFPSLYALLPQNMQEAVGSDIEVTFALGIAAYALWLLFLWMVAFMRITDYYLDAWYITDKRIIDVEQDGFFSREIAVLMHDRIQDLKIEIRGMIETIFDFGNLHAQTAGESREFVIRGVYAPRQQKEEIANIIREFYAKRRDSETDRHE